MLAGNDLPLALASTNCLISSHSAGHVTNWTAAANLHQIEVAMEQLPRICDIDSSVLEHTKQTVLGISMNRQIRSLVMSLSRITNHNTNWCRGMILEDQTRWAKLTQGPLCLRICQAALELNLPSCIYNIFNTQRNKIY